MSSLSRKARRAKQAAQFREARRQAVNPKAKPREVGMMRRRRISWCVAHDSHMSGDSGQCEAAEGELAPWDWEGDEAECREARAYLDLVPVEGDTK